MCSVCGIASPLAWVGTPGDVRVEKGKGYKRTGAWLVSYTVSEKTSPFLLLR